MRVLVTGARGKTGSRIVAAIRRRNPAVVLRGLGRSQVAEADGMEAVTGDVEDPAVRARSVSGVDVVVHYGPAMHPRETAMGTGMIDAAAAGGVARFVYVSVIHPQIDDLLNHQAKLRVEAHLINSGLDWTILRPQHYFQNLDIQGAVAQGFLTAPYPAGTTLGHVDMNDLADAAAEVALNGGHSYAGYDIASGEHLSVKDLCETISEASGKEVAPVALEAEKVVAAIGQSRPLTPYTREAFHRLFAYYERIGIKGNPNVLRWLLGREPGTFRDYVGRCLDGRETRVGYLN